MMVARMEYQNDVQLLVPGTDQPMQDLGCGVFSAIVLITPAIAEILLGLNGRNRVLTQTRLRLYGREMVGDRWTLNGEPIILASGQLCNGQHRLRACMATGAPFLTVVTYLPFGDANKIMASLDRAKARTAGDDFGIAGITNANAAAAVVRTIIICVNRWPLSTSVSSLKIREVFDILPGIARSITLSRTADKNLHSFPASFLGALHFMTSTFAPEAADVFTEKLIDGLGLQAGDPPYALRRVLENNATSNSKIDKVRHWAYLLKAMNAWVADRPLTLLKWNEQAEGVPLLDGFDYAKWQNIIGE